MCSLHNNALIVHWEFVYFYLYGSIKDIFRKFFLWFKYTLTTRANALLIVGQTDQRIWNYVWGQRNPAWKIFVFTNWFPKLPCSCSYCHQIFQDFFLKEYIISTPCLLGPVHACQLRNENELILTQHGPTSVSDWILEVKNSNGWESRLYVMNEVGRRQPENLGSMKAGSGASGHLA